MGLFCARLPVPFGRSCPLRARAWALRRRKFSFSAASSFALRTSLALLCGPDLCRPCTFRSPPSSVIAALLTVRFRRIWHFDAGVA